MLLTDENSWIKRYIQDLIIDWEEVGHWIYWTHGRRDLPKSDFCFCLSFGKMVHEEDRQKFKHTLVVHESDLPKGKGWSPVTWQILEGINCIPVTLIEAANKVDSGCIYAQEWIEFKGRELIDEIREEQAKSTISLCKWFVEKFPKSVEKAKKQKGIESFYKKRNTNDNDLNPNKTIKEQFNLLRVVDNERYLAFFIVEGENFKININKSQELN